MKALPRIDVRNPLTPTPPRKFVLSTAAPRTERSLQPIPPLAGRQTRPRASLAKGDESLCMHVLYREALERAHVHREYEAQWEALQIVIALDEARIYHLPPIVCCRALHIAMEDERFARIELTHARFYEMLALVSMDEEFHRRCIEEKAMRKGVKILQRGFDAIYRLRRIELEDRLDNDRYIFRLHRFHQLEHFIRHAETLNRMRISGECAGAMEDICDAFCEQTGWINVRGRLASTIQLQRAFREIRGGHRGWRSSHRAIGRAIRSRRETPRRMRERLYQKLIATQDAALMSVKWPSEEAANEIVGRHAIRFAEDERRTALVERHRSALSATLGACEATGRQAIVGDAAREGLAIVAAAAVHGCAVVATDEFLEREAMERRALVEEEYRVHPAPSEGFLQNRLRGYAWMCHMASTYILVGWTSMREFLDSDEARERQELLFLASTKKAMLEASLNSESLHRSAAEATFSSSLQEAFLIRHMWFRWPAVVAKRTKALEGVDHEKQAHLRHSLETIEVLRRYNLFQEFLEGGTSIVAVAAESACVTTTRAAKTLARESLHRYQLIELAAMGGTVWVPWEGLVLRAALQMAECIPIANKKDSRCDAYLRKLDEDLRSHRLKTSEDFAGWIEALIRVETMHREEFFLYEGVARRFLYEDEVDLRMKEICASEQRLIQQECAARMLIESSWQRKFTTYFMKLKDQLTRDVAALVVQRQWRKHYAQTTAREAAVEARRVAGAAEKWMRISLEMCEVDAFEAFDRWWTIAEHSDEHRKLLTHRENLLRCSLEAQERSHARFYLGVLRSYHRHHVEEDEVKERALLWVYHQRVATLCDNLLLEWAHRDTIQREWEYFVINTSRALQTHHEI